MPATATVTDRAVDASLSFLQELLLDYPHRDFAVRFWDGTMWETQSGNETKYTLVLQHPASLRRMFSPPSELAMAEAFIYNDVDVKGDLESVFPLAEYLQSRHWGVAERLRFLKRHKALPSDGPQRTARDAPRLSGERHSVGRDRQAVTYHYDTSNDFFSLWLDARMVYSCAYFKTPEDSLDTAQQSKLDYLCRKLRLQPGEKLLDIGCGWGALAIHAAREYGARVLGITLSKPQAELANERIHMAGLDDRCHVEVRDYRELGEPETFDKIVSVGMFEHVGESRLPEYFARAWRLLRPTGVFLNHGIADVPGKAAASGPSFSDRYVFPDGELLPIHTSLRIAEMSGFEVRDVESLREHYALTLRHWVQRLESHHEEACRCTDETTYRIWRLFMSGSAYRFRKGQLNVYQSLLVKHQDGLSKLPLTRTDWYPA